MYIPMFDVYGKGLSCVKTAKFHQERRLIWKKEIPDRGQARSLSLDEVRRLRISLLSTGFPMENDD